MKKHSLLKSCTIALAGLGMMLPMPQVQAAQQMTVKTVQASVLDIGMTREGVFAGRIVDHTGTPASKTEVVVRQGSKEVARTTTDSEGRFAVKGLRGGVYEVSSGKTVGVYRVWQESVAPPSSQDQALLVLGENGARGQFGGMGPGTIVLTAAVVASVIVSTIALDQANDSNDQINTLNDKVNALSDIVSRIPTSP